MKEWSYAQNDQPRSPKPHPRQLCQPYDQGPRNIAQPPSYGWTKAQVLSHWGNPYSVSSYRDADTWLYRRSYFVTTGFGNYKEAEYASVSFFDGKVVGVAY